MLGIKRDHLLTLRVSPAEMKRIKLCAKMAGCSVSALVRTLVNQKLAAFSDREG